jgi:outer membrane immunogenic protein
MELGMELEMKKKLSLAALTICMLATAPAFAADLALPVKAPPLPAYDVWNGWYLGANIGGSFGQARDSASSAGTPFTASNSNSSGVIGGGQFGYNWHVSPLWLLGIEADIQGSSEQSTGTGIAVAPAGTLSDNEKLPWFGTVRGRVGVTPTPGWLLFASGGLAYGDVRSNETLTVGALTATNSGDTVRAGWTAGGGVEAVVARDWTVKVEYLYVDLGSFTNTFTGAGALTPVALSTHVTDNIVRAGFNYHFPTTWR